MPPSRLQTEALALGAYNAALGVAAVLGLAALPWLAMTRHRVGLAERLGVLPPEVAALCGSRPIWIHAASVGEVLAAEPLVRLLRERGGPQLPLLGSATSVAGRDAVRQHLRAPAMLLPADLPWVVRRTLRRLDPRALIILETELWPNLLCGAAWANIPVVLVSARLSPRAGAAYAWVQPLVRTVLRRVCAIAAQTEADAERFRALGAPPDRVHVVGSLKSAREAPAPERSCCPVAFAARPVLVAASTHEGEEEVVLEAARALWREQPEVLLVLAPRHADRFDRVAGLLERLGVRYVRRTDGLEAVPHGVPVLLLDSVGELPFFFPASAAAFVGGTLVDIGGHNVLEPALSGAMVAFGPHVDKVRDAAALLLRAGVAVQVETAGELAEAWRNALRDPRPARERARAVRELLGAPADIAGRTLAVVERWVRLRG